MLPILVKTTTAAGGIEAGKVLVYYPVPGKAYLPFSSTFIRVPLKSFGSSLKLSSSYDRILNKLVSETSKWDRRFNEGWIKNAIRILTGTSYNLEHYKYAINLIALFKTYTIKDKYRIERKMEEFTEDCSNRFERFYNVLLSFVREYCETELGSIDPYAHLRGDGLELDFGLADYDEDYMNCMKKFATQSPDDYDYDPDELMEEIQKMFNSRQDA